MTTKPLVMFGIMLSVGTSYMVSVESHSQGKPTSAASIDGTANAAASHEAVLRQYCYSCHNVGTKRGNLILDNLDLSHVAGDAEVWEKVIRKLRGGVMPPRGLPRPDAKTYKELSSWLESEIDRVAAVRPNPGHLGAVHRLNRAEYQNAVRDVLALEIDASDYLPADDVAGGLDNMASVLKMSPTLMDRYLSAGEKISRLAMGTGVLPTESVFSLPLETQQHRRVEGLPFGTRGGMLVRHTFPVDAEYTFEVGLLPPQGGSNMSGAEEPRPQRLEITIDGEVAKAFELNPVGVVRCDDPLANTNKNTCTVSVRTPVKAGPHEVAVTFVNSPLASGYYLRERRPYERGVVDTVFGMHPLVLGVGKLMLTGPFNVSGAGDSPSRRQILKCHPTKASEETPCAQEILLSLAQRGYRRSVTSADITGLMAAYDDGRQTGDFERGIQTAIWQLLVSPDFIFRTEREPSTVRTSAQAAPEPQSYRISDVELASRLSFFLWSTVPDDELLTLARSKRLHNPVVLENQVIRMLSDRKAQALVDNFIGQWLYLRNIPTMGRPQEVFPDFDETLRDAFVTETRLFFQNLIREDRSLLDVLNANYSFVNERLARHYGIPNIQGSHFRRVTFTDSKRRGILGQGSLFLATSQPNRTSPVLRGKWVMENILGTPPPPPPANVPPLPEQQGAGNKVLTMRERMAEHRKNPACASCHATLDPLGFAFENFDAVGKWRDVDESFTPIDTTGTLPDGTPFASISEFRELLMRQSDNFVSTFAEKLLAYALGRIVDYQDMPAVRRIVREAKAKDSRVSALVLAIVKSAPFQMRNKES